MFPPLCNRIKLQLYDSDTVSDECIATHFIELPQIMDPGGDVEGESNFASWQSWKWLPCEALWVILRVPFCFLRIVSRALYWFVPPGKSWQQAAGSTFSKISCSPLLIKIFAQLCNSIILTILAVCFTTAVTVRLAKCVAYVIYFSIWCY